MNIQKLDFEKAGGLIPAIIQDNNTGKVLMLGFMNLEAISNTLRDKEVWFYSRTRKKLWRKGETSGNVLKLITIVSDCDNDSLLLMVEPGGITCHLGTQSCFTTNGISSIFETPFTLEKTINERFIQQSENSYTVKLLNKGMEKIVQKVGEEAVETVIAAMKENKQELIYETSDLFYHVTVLLYKLGIQWQDIFKELQKRTSK
jgi:phosphoribosyl-ATP pyrophosphohydrolase/phosphoribosyl-AMP cyclohydrolase